jgi:serine/threonine protein kinase
MYDVKQRISKSVFELIRDMLELDPNKRPSISNVVKTLGDYAVDGPDVAWITRRQ